MKGFILVRLNVPLNGSNTSLSEGPTKVTPGATADESSKSIGSIVTTSVPASVFTPSSVTIGNVETSESVGPVKPRASNAAAIALAKAVSFAAACS